MIDDLELASRQAEPVAAHERHGDGHGAGSETRPNALADQRWRLNALLAMVVGFALVIAGRLVLIQVVQHDHYERLANAEHWQKVTVHPRRGEIVDASGVTLAASVPYEDVYANTKAIDDARAYAAKLAPILQVDSAALESTLATPLDAPALLKAELSADRASQVRQLALPGIELRPGEQRVHPQGNLAAQLIGVVGADEEGLSGLEAALDGALGGQPGWVYAERDTEGDEIALGGREEEPPIDGARVQLTIDRYVQQVAERELTAAVQKQHAQSGSVVVLDPKTGAILAMAGYPSIRYDDPALYDSPPGLFRAIGASDQYEPGSVFKIFTMAAALDGGAVRPETTIVDGGRFTYAGGTIKNARIFPPHPSTMTLVLQRSSNVGAAYAATKLGARRFYDYLAAFGFGRQTGSMAPGEADGLVHQPGDPTWTDFDLATNAFGQGLAVTPLQLAAGAAAIANGGTLLRPYLVSQIDGPLEKQTYHPTIVRQAISPRTARDLTEMMVATVDYVEAGAHRLCYLPQYSLAGKTGTAEIPTPRGYDRVHTIASFVGFGPAEDPRFVVVVRIDRPTDSVWAESVAAPVFRNISKALLDYYRIAPNPARLASKQAG